MIQLITKRNTQGYYADFLLKVRCKTNVETLYLDKFNLSDTSKYNQQADVIIVFGFPVVKSEFSVIEEAMDMYNNAFSSFYHFCSYGEQIPSDWITSIVDEVESPLRVMWDNLRWERDKSLLHPSDQLIVEELQVIENTIAELNKYHKYTFFEEGNMTPLNLTLLGNFYGEGLYEATNGNTHFLLDETTQVTLSSLLRNWHHYTMKALERTNYFMVSDVTIALVYAEDYPNEIAHFLRNIMVSNHVGKGLILIGKHTKGDDMFHVRTLNMEADKMAYTLNKGKGKKDSAVVFLGNTSEIVVESVRKILNSYLNS